MLCAAERPHGNHRDSLVATVGCNLTKVNGTSNDRPKGIVIVVISVLHHLKASPHFVENDIYAENNKKNKDTTEPNETRVGPKVVSSSQKRNAERQGGQPYKEGKVDPIDDNLTESVEGEVPSQGVATSRVLVQDRKELL